MGEAPASGSTPIAAAALRELEYWWYVLALIVAYIVPSIVESIPISINRMIAGAYGPPRALLWSRYPRAVDRRGGPPAARYEPPRVVDPVAGDLHCLAFAMGGAVMMTGGWGRGSAPAGIFLLIGAICAIVLLVSNLPGTPGDNRYGPNPYGSQGTAAAAWNSIRLTGRDALPSAVHR